MRRALDIAPTTAALAPSALWTGMSLGRFLLGFLTERLGVGRAVTIYITSALACSVLLILAKNAAAVLAVLGVAGVFLGPLYPSGIVLLTTKLPVESHVSAIAAAAALGQVGGASAPFAIAVVSDHVGIGLFPDIICGLLGLVLVVWVVLARLRPA
jgi:fucose permease